VFAQEAWCGERLLASGKIKVGCVGTESLRPAVILMWSRKKFLPDLPDVAGACQRSECTFTLCYLLFSTLIQYERYSRPFFFKPDQ
jgi:hypothetical protein